MLRDILGQVAKELTVGERAAIKGGTGHYLIADGTSEVSRSASRRSP
jgi:hypothetical protein